MSNYSTLLDLISPTQANKEAVVNANFDAASPSMIWGRHALTTAGLTWGYYGGQYGGNAIANGTVTLTASTTNYVYADNVTGAVSVNTTGVPAGKIPLYQITTGTITVSNYTDLRSYAPAGLLAGTVSSVGATGGVETDQSGGGAIMSTGNIRTNTLLAGGAIQTAAYTFVTGDRGKALITNSSSAVSQALPTPTGSSGNFPGGWWGHAENIGAGVCTLTVPSGVNLDGVTNGTLALSQSNGVKFFTDGTNWFTIRGIAGSGGSTTLAGLTDVNVTEGAGIDGKVLTWNNTTSKWIASTAGGGSRTAPSIVQSQWTGGWTGGTPTTTTLTLSSTPTVGNTLVAIVNGYGTTITPSDLRWNQLGQWNDTSAQCIAVFSRPVITGDGTSFTFSAPVNQPLQGMLYEISGAGEVKAWGRFDGKVASSATEILGGFAPCGNCLMIAAQENANNNATATFSSGWTADHNTATVSSGFNQNNAHQVVSTGGPVRGPQLTWTNASTSFNCPATIVACVPPL
ncbi:hypothetical protein [Burkholderia sp. Ac-20353]|uniref:hypothetical protein n=1 Tax=Burkholderia sp. Ac-20353 TaxID=2703894 RepID=UPI001F11FDE7|nr:hypothetical protein [Burkholderia sp. Ac-20353]